MNNTKICRECHIEKPLDNFAKGRRACRDCKNLYLKEYYQQNKEKHAEKGKEWRENNKEKYKQYQKEYKIKNKEYILKKQKEYREDPQNKKKINKVKLDWQKKKTKEDPSFKINRNISNGIWHSLKNTNKKKGGKHWEDLVGYTIKEFIDHIESLWEPWMNWENHGIYQPEGPKTWQIDHIIPKSMFKFESYEDEEFKLCWSLNNLQPKESKKNNSKRAKYIG